MPPPLNSVSDSRVVKSSDFAVDRLYQYLSFVLYRRSNNSTYEIPYANSSKICFLFFLPKS